MYRILMLVAATAMIGGNLLNAQEAQESRVQYRIGDTERADFNPAATETAHRGQAAATQATFQDSSSPLQSQVYRAPRRPIQQAPAYQTRQGYQQVPQQTRQSYQAPQPTRQSYQQAPQQTQQSYQQAPQQTRQGYQQVPQQTRQSYQQVPQREVYQYPVQTRIRNYVPPIPKDVIPPRETSVLEQVVETKEPKAEQNHRFAPRKTSGSYSLRLDEYSQRNATSPAALDSDATSRRIIQLRSESNEPANQQTVRNSEPTPFIEKLETFVDPPKMDPPKTEWVAPQVVESKVEQTQLPDPVSQIEVVEAADEWVQPRMQFKKVEAPQPKVVQASPMVKLPAVTPVTKPTPKISPKTLKVTQDRTFKAFQPAPEKPAEPALPALPVAVKQVETKIEKSVVGNEFSPQPTVKEKPDNLFFPPKPPRKTEIKKSFVGNDFAPQPVAKKEFNNSFLPPIPKKEFVRPAANQFGSAKKQPTFKANQSELPVQTFEAPQLPTRVATNSSLQTPEAAGWWWLYLLPIIPLLLVGWFIMRGSSVGDEAPIGGVRERYREPVAPAVPREKRYSADTTATRSVKTKVPTGASIASGKANAGTKLKVADATKHIPMVRKETASVKPKTKVSNGLQIFREEDEEVCENSLEATKGCCSADEETSSCCNTLESSQQEKKTKFVRRPDAKSNVEKSQDQNLASTPVVAPARSSKIYEAKSSEKGSQSSPRVGEQMQDSKSVGSKTAEKTDVEKAAIQKAKQKKVADFANSFTSKPKKFELGNNGIKAGNQAKSNQEIAGKKSEVTKTDSATSVSSGTTKTKFDDLTKIRGIDPDVASQLRDNGIDSFSMLSAASPERIRQILMSGGTKFQFINPTQWPDQAELAAKSDWKGLRRWQTYHKELPSLKVEQEVSAPAMGATNKTSEVDLTKIRGISPEIAKTLRDSGINSYSKLAKAKPEKIKQILKSGGSKFQYINPTRWPEQAEIAAHGDWNGLIRWQAKFKELPSLKSTEANPEKKTVRQTTGKKASAKPSASDKDDLTRINGVGAATQRFLNKNEIFSFAQIASMDNARLQAIFADRGNRFQLLNTETWAAQAKEIMESTGEESQSSEGSQSSSESNTSTTNIFSLDTTGSYSTDQQVSN